MLTAIIHVYVRLAGIPKAAMNMTERGFALRRLDGNFDMFEHMMLSYKGP